MGSSTIEKDGQLELMAESPVADVYADSLIAAADEQDRVRPVYEAFGDLLAYMDRDRQFAGFLTSESVDSDPRAITLEKLFRGKLEDLLLNFLLVLNRRGRMGLIRQIYRCTQLRMEERRHQQEVTVETAMPLDDALRAALIERLQQYIGKEPLLTEVVRPELIGGVVICVGDLQIDASVATRIAAVRKNLSERATVEIHRGTGVE